eukprot:gene30301-36613_t
MWGNFIKNAAALATEQAQSIVGNASQFLERLDGIGASMEDEEGQQDSVTEVESDKMSDLDGAVSNHSVPTTSPVERQIGQRSSSPDVSDLQDSASRQNESLSGPKKSAMSAAPVSPSRTAEPVLIQSSDSLDAHQPTNKPADVKKYQARIRKLEKEKSELEQQASELQLSVASLSKELQSALAEKPSRDDLHDRQDLLDQIASLKEDQENTESRFATQLAAVREQYERELSRRCAEYETKIGELKAKFQAQEEELLVLQLKKDHQRKKDEDHAELENKLRELAGQCKSMVENYQTLQQSHDEMSYRCEALSSELSVKVQQIATLQESYESKLQEVEELRGSAVSLSSEHASMADEFKALQEAYASKAQELDELRSSVVSKPLSEEPSEELLAARKSYEELLEKYDNMESEFNALASREEQDRASMVQLMDQIREQETRHDDLVAQLTSLQEQLNGQMERAEKLHVENCQLIDGKTILEKSCHELRLQVEELAARGHCDEKLPSAATPEDTTFIEKPSGKPAGKKGKKGGKKRGGHEIYSINISSVAATEGSVDADESEVAEVAPAENTADVEGSSNTNGIQMKMSSLEKECQDLLSKLDELVDKHQGLQDKYDGKESDYHMLIEELNKKEDENNSLYHQFEKLSHDYSALLDQHKELTQKQSQFDQGAGEEADNMKNAFEELQRRHDDYVNKFRELEEAHTSTLESYATLQDELYNLKFEQASTLKDNEEQIAECESKLSALQVEKDRLMDLLEEKELNCQELKEGLDSLKAKSLEQESVVVATLNAELSETKDLAHKAIASQKELQDRYNLAQSQLEELKGRSSTLENELVSKHEKISELEEANAALQTDLINLRAQCDAFEKSSRTLQERIREIEASTSAETDEQRAMDEQLKSLKAEYSISQEALTRITKERDDLQQQCSDLESAVAAAIRDGEAHDAVVATYEAKMLSLANEVDHTKKQYEEASLALQQADIARSVLDTEVKALKRDLLGAKSTSEAMEAEKNNVQSQLQGLIGEKERLQSEFSAAKQALQQQIILCDKLSGESAEAQEKLRLFTTQSQELKEQQLSRYNALQLQFSQSQEALSQARSEVAVLQGQCAELTKKNSKLEQDNQYINQQYMNLMSQSSGETAALKESIDLLEKDKAKVLTQYQQSQLQRDDLQRRVSQLEGDLEKFHQQAQGVDNKKKKDLEALKKQNELINFLQQKIFSLEQQLSSSSTAAASAVSSPEATTTDDLSTLREQLTRLQADYTALQESKQERISSLEQQMQDLTIQIGSLAAEKHSLAQQVEVLEKQAVDLNDAFDKAQKSHEEKVTELNTLLLKYQTNQESGKRDPALDDAAEKIKRLHAQIETLGREKKELQQQIEELSQHLTNAYEKGRQSSASLPLANTYDEELGGMTVEREKKASIGSQVYVVQGWNLIRQNCPGALVHHLPDRPPRLSVAAQIAIVYGLFLQIA